MAYLTGTAPIHATSDARIDYWKSLILTNFPSISLVSDVGTGATRVVKFSHPSTTHKLLLKYYSGGISPYICLQWENLAGSSYLTGTNQFIYLGLYSTVMNWHLISNSNSGCLQIQNDGAKFNNVLLFSNGSGSARGMIAIGSNSNVGGSPNANNNEIAQGADTIFTGSFNGNPIISMYSTVTSQISATSDWFIQIPLWDDNLAIYQTVLAYNMYLFRNANGFTSGVTFYVDSKEAFGIGANYTSGMMIIVNE